MLINYDQWLLFIIEFIKALNLYNGLELKNSLSFPAPYRIFILNYFLFIIIKYAKLIKNCHFQDKRYPRKRAF